MSNEICICGNGLSNMALPLCLRLQKVIKKVVFVPLRANDGTLNKLATTVTTAAGLSALVNNADKSKRWFPTPEIKNIETPKDAAVFEKYNDDSSNFIREGVRKFTGLIPVCPPMFKNKLESVRCNSNTGVFLIDLEGNVIGLKVGTDNVNIYPIPVNAQSILANVKLADDKTTTGIMLEFEFPASMQDADIRWITGSNFSDVNPLDLSGLIDVNVEYSSDAVSSTIIYASLTTPSPSFDQPIPIQGLVAANFVSSVTGATQKLRNTTDGADVTISACVEETSGHYKLTFTSSVSKTMVGFISLAGYDAAAMKLVSFTTL